MFDLKSLHGTFWLAEPMSLRRAVARVAAIPACPTGRQIVEEHKRRIELAREAATRSTVKAVRGRVGVIPVYGPIDQRVSAMTEKLGGTATEEVSVALRAMLASPDISAIVLDVDSPGGGSYGVSELSDQVFAGRAAKPIYAVANSMMASAAYWIGSAATEVFATPGGDVGSVGVYAVHIDESKAMEAEGLSVTVVQAGKYKTEFSSHAPLGAEAKAYLQDQVDATYRQFVDALARNRGRTEHAVRKTFGDGRVFDAEGAVAAGMADKVMTLDALLTKLTGGASAPGAGRKASVEMLRLRHSHRMMVEPAA